MKTITNQIYKNNTPAKGVTMARYRSKAMRAMVMMDTVPKRAPQKP